MNGTALRLGAFELEAPLAQGGMADVWRGVHAAERVAVAVKVLTSSLTREPEYLAAFRTEVRAVALLDHPGIVVVLDHGEVPPAVAEASGGRLVTGSPYLVMELARLGTLRAVRHPLRWRELRAVLLSLLDAFAHAHARGVVHRDLKPGNVLVDWVGEAATLKLTDFGIAHLESPEQHAPPHALRAFGTPGYMAPEQLRGAWREVGAWTDLYALGCLAFVLAAGRNPWGGSSPDQTAEAQLLRPAPAIEPAHPCPPGFDAWVARLLERDPSRRFARAADAAWALQRLGDVAPPDAAGERPFWSALLDEERRRPTAERATEPRARDEAPSSAGTLTVPFHALADLDRDVHSHAAALPPVPRSWRRTSAPPPPMRLVGAGLRLFPLRTIRLVGREAERDALWAALREVDAGRGPRAQVVRGASGVGKSRLVEWVSERAHEVGAATVLRASHGPGGEHGDGLARMLLAHFRAHGLDRGRLAQRLERELKRLGASEAREWQELYALLAPLAPHGAGSAPPPPATRGRFETAAERHLAVEQVLSRIAAHRPVLVWLDDVQWGAEALELATHALSVGRAGDEGAGLRVLFVLTVQEEALAERPHEARLVARLLEEPGAAELPLRPLSEEEVAGLVADALRLDRRLAGRVVARARGNPLFAVQLVGDWVQRGALRVGPTGFELAGGEEAPLPDDLHAVWRARVHRLLQSRASTDELALEVAAALGPAVQRDEWLRAATAAGAVLDAGLEEALVASRLALPVRGGFELAHGMLRESLERASREAGRLPAVHRAIAAALEAPAAAGDEHAIERLGRHRHAAGDLDAAFAPLLEGATYRRERCDYPGAGALLDLAEDALRRRAAPADDPRWGEVWLARAWLARLVAAYDDAERWAQQTRERARTHGWTLLEAEAQARLGEVALRRGDLRTAERETRDAMAELARAGSFVGVGRTRWTLGWVRLLRGDAAAACELFEGLLGVAGALGPVAAGAHLHSLWSLGHALARSGELERAETLHLAAVATGVARGNRLARAHGHHGLQTVARLRGELEVSEDHARRALALFASIGSGEAYSPRFGLGLAYLDAGRVADARAELERGLAEVVAAGRTGLETLFVVPLCECAVLDGDLESVDGWLTRAEGCVAWSGMADRDLERVARRLVAQLCERGERPRAARAEALVVALAGTAG